MPGVDWFAALPCYAGMEPAAGWVDKLQKTIPVAGWSQAQALLVAEYKMVGDVRRWFQSYKATKCITNASWPGVQCSGSVSPKLKRLQGSARHD